MTIPKMASLDDSSQASSLRGSLLKPSKSNTSGLRFSGKYQNSQQAQDEKERKKLMKQQEDLVRDQYKMKRQANLASVKNAYINLEK